MSGSNSLVEMLQESNLDKKDILTLVADMLLAGIDTTSYTSSFMFYLLAKHQNVQYKLREQIRKGELFSNRDQSTKTNQNLNFFKFKLLFQWATMFFI